MGYSIRIITEYHDFLALRPDWAELLQSSHNNRVFLTHQWFQCWWETFGKNLDLTILVTYDNDRVSGIAPLCIQQSRYWGLPVKQVQFMANGYTEEACIILARENEVTALDLMLGQLISKKHQWDISNLKTVRNEPVFMEKLIQVLNKNNLKCLTYPSKQVPYIPIAGTWEEFYSRKTRRFKKAFKARKNKISRYNKPVRIERIQGKKLVNNALNIIYEISRNSWKAENNKSLDTDAAAWSFIQNLATRLSPLGWIEVWLLYVGNKAIAFEYHFIYDGVTSPIRADFDEHYRKLSPGAYLEVCIIQELFEEENSSITEYNTCADGYAYTLRMTDMIHEHSTIRIFSPTLYGEILYWLFKVKKMTVYKKEKKLVSVRQ